MKRDPSSEWPDERLRSEIEATVEAFEQAVRRHEASKFEQGEAGARREEARGARVLGLRDALIEEVYNLRSEADIREHDALSRAADDRRYSQAVGAMDALLPGSTKESP